MSGTGKDQFLVQVVLSQPKSDKSFVGSLNDLAPCQLVQCKFLKEGGIREKKYLLIQEVKNSSLEGFVVGEGDRKQEFPFERISTIWIEAEKVTSAFFEFLNQQAEQIREQGERLARIEQRFSKLLR